MSLITAQKIKKQMGQKELFKNSLTFAIEAQDRVGLIGPNGVGKSTLVRILTGEIQPDEGQVTKKNFLKMAIVAQQDNFKDDDRLCDLAGYEILSRMGFTDPNAQVANLSGGWRKRLAIAQAWESSPDVLFLDEPSNHLDFESTLWLQDFLNSCRCAWVLISHDRYLIAKSAQRIVEINPIFFDGLHSHQGSYESFLEHRQEHLEGQKQHQQSLANKLRREVEWSRQGVKARTTKSKYRMAQVSVLSRELEAMSIKDNASLAQSFSSTDRQSKKLIESTDLAIGYDHPLYHNLNFILGPRSRLGLLGANGSGKSTFLKTIAEKIQPLSGTLRRVRELSVVYFDQKREQLNEEWTLARALSDTGEMVQYQGRSLHIASWAKAFKFNVQQLTTPVAQLSGGEKARILIARLMQQKADVLLLDEPSNDLDMETLELLEERLEEFPGAVVLVTHDRAMLSSVCDEFLAPPGVSYASYEQWENEEIRRIKKCEALTTKPLKEKPKPQSKKLSYMEQRELDSIEGTILEAETLLEQLTHRANSDAKEAIQLYSQIEEQTLRIESLYQRWSDLTQKTQ